MPVREPVHTRPLSTRTPRLLLRQSMLEFALCVAACFAFLSRRDEFGLQRNERQRECSKTLACRFVWSATVTRNRHARAHRSKHSRTVMTRVVDSHATCNATQVCAVPIHRWRDVTLRAIAVVDNHSSCKCANARCTTNVRKNTRNARCDAKDPRVYRARYDASTASSRETAPQRNGRGAVGRRRARS